MKKKSFLEYPVRLEIINDYLILKVKELDLITSVGRFSANQDVPIFPPSELIGKTYYQMLFKIKEELDKIDSLQPLEEKEKALTMNEAAHILGVSLSSVRRMIDAGNIKCQKTKGKHRKPLMSSVYAYKNSSVHK